MSKRNKTLLGNTLLLFILLSIIFMAVYQPPSWSIFVHLYPACSDCLPASLIGVLVGSMLCHIRGSVDPVSGRAESRVTPLNVYGILLIMFTIFVDDIATSQFTALTRLAAYVGAAVLLTYHTWLVWLHRKKVADLST